MSEKNTVEKCFKLSIWISIDILTSAIVVWLLLLLCMLLKCHSASSIFDQRHSFQFLPSFDDSLIETLTYFGRFDIYWTIPSNVWYKQQLHCHQRQCSTDSDIIGPICMHKMCNYSICGLITIHVIDMS